MKPSPDADKVQSDDEMALWARCNGFWQEWLIPEGGLGWPGDRS